METQALLDETYKNAISSLQEPLMVPQQQQQSNDKDDAAAELHQPLIEPQQQQQQQQQQQDDGEQEEVENYNSTDDDEPSSPLGNNNHEAGGGDGETLNDVEDDDDEPVIAAANNSTRRVFQRIALSILLATVWTSGILFGLYMIGYYLVALIQYGFSSSRVQRRWNSKLPGLYSVDRPWATAGMGAHLLGGSITIILGAIQLLHPVRKRFPAFHRWIGRLYLFCSALTASGGLLYIWRSQHGCIGGMTMNIAFSMCAVLTLLSTAQAYRHAAITKQYAQHKLWAWRLYSLMISSWMYRWEYATAEILLGRAAHDPEHYSYALDYIMDFFFYVPNLIVVEILWRTRHLRQPALVSHVLSVGMILLAVLILLMTFLLSMVIWIPGMLGHSPNDDDDDDGYDDDTTPTTEL